MNISSDFRRLSRQLLSQFLFLLILGKTAAEKNPLASKLDNCPDAINVSTKYAASLPCAILALLSSTPGDNIVDCVLRYQFLRALLISSCRFNSLTVISVSGLVLLRDWL